MIVQLVIVRDGRPYPLTVVATQVVARQDNGTPILVAAEYGPEGGQAVSKVGDDDFNRTLRSLGIPQRVACDTIVMPPPPPGARLVAGPDLGVNHGR